jgi:hypothetical protein
MVAGLLVVLPPAVGLPLRAELATYAEKRAEQRVTVVGRGRTGDLGELRWLLRRTATTTKTLGLTLPPAAVPVRFDVYATAVGGGSLSSPDLRYEARDRLGRTWVAREGQNTRTRRAGKPPQLHLALIAAVPRDVADQVELVIGYQKARPREQVLLFRR